MTLVASPTPSVLSIASSSSSSSCGDQSPRQFAFDSLSDVSPLTPNNYRSGHNVRSQSQPGSPATSVISSLNASSRIQNVSHSLEDANRLGGKNSKTSGRSVSASFGGNSSTKKEKKKLTTRRLIDREKHSANECRRRTEMREKFFQLQEITHCVYKDRQNILVTAIRRIAEQNARIARLEKEKQSAFREQGIVAPKAAVSCPDSPTSAVPAPAMVVSALSCKTETLSPEVPVKVLSIPVNTLASIGATELLPSFLLAHPDTIVDVNALFVSLFRLSGREVLQSTTLSSLCATSDDMLQFQAATENILLNEPHHVALGVHLNVQGETYSVQLILRAIVSNSAPPQIYGVVSELKNLPKEIKPINIADSAVLPAVIIKEEPGLHSMTDNSNTEKVVNKFISSPIHSNSAIAFLDKDPNGWDSDTQSTISSESTITSDMDVAEPLYGQDEGYDAFFARFNPSPFPINLSHHMPMYDQFTPSAILSSARRPSISSAFVDTTIWNDLM